MLFRIFTLVTVFALAVSTWILSSPAHRPKSGESAPGAKLPGYYLKNAVLTDFDAEGAPTLRMEAERIDQVDNGVEVALSKVTVHYTSPNGQRWVLIGDAGHVEPGGKIIDVSGNVKVRGESTEHAGTAVIETNALSYNVPDSVVSTPSDVRIEFGAQTLTARGLQANLRDRTMRLESRVNGRFQR